MLNVGCYVVMSSAMYESNSTRERSETLSFRSTHCGLCCSSRGANSERFPCESAGSMENDRKRELEKLTMAIREIKKKIKSERAGMAGSAEPRKSAGHWSWPFEVRAALCVWVVTLNMRAAIEFVNDWKRRRKNVTAWSQDQIREEAVSLTDWTKNLLVKPATKRGRLALAEAGKFLKEKQLFDWVKEQNSRKGLAPSYSALWRQWTHETESQGPEACDDELGRPRDQKQRTQRVRRWARRWIVIRGCYKPGPRLDLETLRGKAIWHPRGC